MEINLIKPNKSTPYSRIQFVNPKDIAIYANKKKLYLVVGVTEKNLKILKKI